MSIADIVAVLGGARIFAHPIQKSDEMVAQVRAGLPAATITMLADSLSLQLPRKYKIAFAACDKDFSGATVLHRAQTKRRGRLCGLCRRRHGRQNPAGQPAA